MREWLELGGVLEDQGSILTSVGRYYRHFHDPLKSWDDAGLSATGLGQSESSIRWMQNRRQTLTGAAGGNWSWHDARRMYYQSLIEPDPERRDALMAATFRALGQIMHLVVDASNPDHARNDPHPLPSAPLLGILFWNYDKTVELRHGRAGSDEEQAFVRRYLSNPIGFDRAIFQFPNPPGEHLATVPISRLIDADVYTGANPQATFNAADSSAPVAIGIGEVSNANFFSENTLTGPYPNPPTGTEGLIRTELQLPRRTPGGLNLVRRYWSRPAGQGFLPANPLRAECAGSRNPRSATPPYPCVDDVVFDQVAAHMLPRAVGYARGVLEYFFRGRIRVRQVIPRLTGVLIDIENDSDEPLEGVFEVHARDGRGTPAETRRLFSLVNDGQPVSLEPGESGMFSMPVTAAPAAYHVLVFRGRLGVEQEAVVGQVFAVPHVQFVQTSYSADVTSSCVLSSIRRRFTDAVPMRDVLECTWRPVNYRIEGRLVTNFGESDPRNPSEPVIEQIQAVWEGAVPGPASLRVAGADYPAGIWRRQGDEADPDAFTIIGATHDASALRLSISIRGGITLSSQVATFRRLSTSSSKTVRDSSSPGWDIFTGRATDVIVNIDAGRFSTISIGGYPLPTSILGDPLPQGVVRSEAITVTATLGGWGSDSVNQFAANIATTSLDVEAAFNSIELMPPPFPKAPALDFSAVVRPKPSSTVDRMFWNAFVAPGDPSDYSIVLRAHEPGTQEMP